MDNRTTLGLGVDTEELSLDPDVVWRLNSLLNQVSPDGRRYIPRAEEPENPKTGEVYLADAQNWNPDSTSNNAHLVIYIDGNWQRIAEFNTSLDGTQYP